MSLRYARDLAKPKQQYAPRYPDTIEVIHSRVVTAKHILLQSGAYALVAMHIISSMPDKATT